MMFLLFTSMSLPILVGFLLITYLWPNHVSLRSFFGVKSCLAVGLGFGLTSLMFFLWLLFFKTFDRNFIIIETSLYISLSLIFFFLIKQKKVYQTHRRELVLNQNRSLYLSWGLYIIFATALSVFSLISLNRPHGGTDAWTIWNATARFLNGACEKWAAAFFHLSPISHPDYPLLLSGIIARTWGYLANQPPAVPILFAMIFTISTLVLMVSSLIKFQGQLHGYLAGIAILALPGFIKVGAAQIADVPLGFYVLSTLILFCCSDSSLDRRSSFIFMAGLMAGFSAWTKNEGLLFVGTIILARSIFILPKEGKMIFLKEIITFAAGLFPTILVVFYFKTQIAPANDLISGQGLDVIVSRLVDPSRHLIIAKAFLKELYSFGKLRILIFPLCLLFFGVSPESKFNVNIRSGLLMVVLMLSGYYCIYLITPYDLVWHLSSSLQRLYVQLLPSAIFIFFLSIKKPEFMAIKK